MKTIYERAYTVLDAQILVNRWTQAGYKAYYQTLNSCNYQVRIWK